MSKLLNVEDLYSQGFKRGSVVRVLMKNFLTYDEAEVFPGPHLNVVLGPNGTGKSSLTHAICLACNGSPQLIGKSNDISQFVKLGKPKNCESFCEVDILDDVRITLYLL